MESGRTLSPEPLGFFALGFHRQGGRTRKPLVRRQAILPTLCKAYCSSSCVRSGTLPSGAVIFGLQGITGATETRTVAGPGAVLPCKSRQPKPHFVLAPNYLT